MADAAARCSSAPDRLCDLLGDNPAEHCAADPSDGQLQADPSDGQLQSGALDVAPAAIGVPFEDRERCLGAEQEEENSTSDEEAPLVPTDPQRAPSGSKSSGKADEWASTCFSRASIVRLSLYLLFLLSSALASYTLGYNNGRAKPRPQREGPAPETPSVVAADRASLVARGGEPQESDSPESAREPEPRGRPGEELAPNAPAKPALPPGSKPLLEGGEGEETDPRLGKTAGDPGSAGSGLSLYCFSWTTRRPQDEDLMREVSLQFSFCDGHAFFTDTEAPRGDTPDDPPDMIRVALPQQKESRDSKRWLWHRNMVGLMPTWSYIIEKGLADKYDWFINVELDMVTNPARVRLMIAKYLDMIRQGKEPEKADGALMLGFGNAFVFNRKILRGFRKHWQLMGQTANGTGGAPEDTDAVGCPEYMRNKQEWPKHCSQDICYQHMVKKLDSLEGPEGAFAAANIGPGGCGKPFQTQHNMTIPCFQLKNPPFGQQEEQSLLGIRELARVHSMKSSEEAKAYYEREGGDLSLRKYWKYLWDSRNVAIIHQVYFTSVHKLAHELLLKDR